MTEQERMAASRLAESIRTAERAQGEDLARAQAMVAYWKTRLIQASYAAMQAGA